ncbi:MAG: hypothetical protein N2234_10040, partial [Planctomycetota bacterium]|nr:hypothetical protein [Planctomycetota bacterium]
KYPMQIRSHSVENEVCFINLGDEYEVVNLPQTQILNSPFGFYSLVFDYEKEKKRLKVEQYFTLYAPRVEAKDYHSVVEFARKVDEAETAKIVVRKKSR